MSIDKNELLLLLLKVIITLHLGPGIGRERPATNRSNNGTASENHNRTVVCLLLGISPASEF